MYAFHICTYISFVYIYIYFFYDKHLFVLFTLKMLLKIFLFFFVFLFYCTRYTLNNFFSGFKNLFCVFCCCCLVLYNTENTTRHS